MKAFIYNKDNKSECYKIVKNVVEVKSKKGWLYITQEDGFSMAFDTKKYKTTIYQN